MAKCFVISQWHLGEMISFSTCFQYFRDQGYDIHLLINPPNYCVYNAATNMQVTPMPYRRVLSFLREHYSPEDVVVVGGWGHTRKIIQKLSCSAIGPRFRLNALPPLMRARDEAVVRDHWARQNVLLGLPGYYLGRLGITRYPHYWPEIAFHKTELSLPKKTILLNYGSNTSGRRSLHPNCMRSIYVKLKDAGYNVLVACIVRREIDRLKSLGVPVLSANLITTLNLVEQCDLMISPDSGLGHVSCALKRPMLMLESFFRTEHVFWHYDGLHAFNGIDSGAVSKICTAESCPVVDKHCACMTKINADLLLEKVKSIL